jgi:hypothetical protein
MVKNVLAWLDFIAACISVISRNLRQTIEEWPKLPEKNTEGFE